MKYYTEFTKALILKSINNTYKTQYLPNYIQRIAKNKQTSQLPQIKQYVILSISVQMIILEAC